MFSFLKYSNVHFYNLAHPNRFTVHVDATFNFDRLDLVKIMFTFCFCNCRVHHVYQIFLGHLFDGYLHNVRNGSLHDDIYVLGDASNNLFAKHRFLGLEHPVPGNYNLQREQSSAFRL